MANDAHDKATGISAGTAIVLLMLLVAVGFVAALFLSPRKPRLVIDPYTRKPVDLDMANTPADEYVERQERGGTQTLTDDELLLLGAGSEVTEDALGGAPTSTGAER